MSLEICLSELADYSRPVLSLGLEQLSDASPEDVRKIQETCLKLEIQRRRDLIDELLFLARSNARLNFDAIFFFCLVDSDAKVRAGAIEGLWECEDYVLIPTLLEILAGDEDDSVRVAAANKLGKLAVRAVTKKVHSRYIQMIGDSLMGVINTEGESIELIGEAMEALASIDFPGAQEVINSAHQSSNPEMRLSAVRSMGLNCSRVWLPVLLQELDNPEDTIRLEAVKACGELGEDEVITPLVRFVSESNIQEKLTALGALKQIGGDEVKQAASQYLDHSDEQVRRLAQEICEEDETDIWDN